MNDSLAYVFCIRPGERIHDARDGVESSRCRRACTFGNEYDGAESWWIFPGLIASLCGNPASVAAIVGGHSVISVLGIQNSDCQATILPFESRPPRISTRVGGPLGSQPCSSSRIHWTRTGRPPISRELSAASQAAAAWPLRPR